MCCLSFPLLSYLFFFFLFFSSTDQLKKFLSVANLPLFIYYLSLRVWASLNFLTFTQHFKIWASFQYFFSLFLCLKLIFLLFQVPWLTINYLFVGYFLARVWAIVPQISRWIASFIDADISTEVVTYILKVVWCWSEL